jgi:hypothetical protein
MKTDSYLFTAPKGSASMCPIAAWPQVSVEELTFLHLPILRNSPFNHKARNAGYARTPLATQCREWAGGVEQVWGIMRAGITPTR